MDHLAHHELEMVVRLMTGDDRDERALLDLTAPQRERIERFIVKGHLALSLRNPNLFEFQRLARVRNAALALQLSRVASRFDAAGLEFMPMKGVCLSQWLHGRPDARAYGDIDLLIRPRDRDSAAELLTGLGYRCASLPARATDRQREQVATVEKDLMFVHDSAGFVLDLHWSMFPDRWHVFDSGLLWQDRQEVVVGGRAYAMPEPVLGGLYVIAHAALSGWYRMLWVVDALAVFESVDEDALLRRAPSLGMMPMLAEAYLLRELIERAPLPAPIEDYLATHRVVRRAFATNLPTIYALDPPRTALIRHSLLLLPGLRQRAGLVSYYLHPRVKDWHLFELAERVPAAYYLVRGYRILSEAWRAARAAGRN